jgi:hypothetical protein
MFSSNLTKFFAAFALIFLLFSGCRFWQKTNDADLPPPAVSDDLKSEIPFAAKEPEEFQAETIVTAGAIERRTFVARRGPLRRYDFNFGAKNQVTRLETDKTYLILPDKKIFAEMIAEQTAAADDWTDFLTTEWLSEKRPARFEKLETAENLTKYRVRSGDDEASEVFVYIDEKSGFPVKQEFYAATGAERVLTYKFELKNLEFRADENLFALPADLRKVSAEEFRKILRDDEQK